MAEPLKGRPADQLPAWATDPLRVGVDLDGFGYDFLADAANLAIDHFGVARSVTKKISDWDFLPHWGIDPDEFWEAAESAVTRGAMFAGPPVEGFAEMLAEIRCIGHTIHIITARPGFATEATGNWLAKYGLEFDSLHLVADKSMVNVDVFVDDHIHNLDVVTAAAPATVTVLWDTPWNKQSSGHRRVAGFDEFVTVVRQTAGDGFQVPVSKLEEALDAELALQAGPRAHSSLSVHSGQRAERPLEPLDPRGRTSDVGGETRVTAASGGEKGAKAARYGLIPTGPLKALAEHYAMGDRKYPLTNGMSNWRNGFPISLSYDALCRHLNAFWGGENIDADSGSPHLAAVAWHAFTIMELLADTELAEAFDDRQDGRRRRLRETGIVADPRVA